jgi:hypothetical protein
MEAVRALNMEATQAASNIWPGLEILFGDRFFVLNVLYSTTFIESDF